MIKDKTYFLLTILICSVGLIVIEAYLFSIGAKIAALNILGLTLGVLLAFSLAEASKKGDKPQ